MQKIYYCLFWMVILSNFMIINMVNGANVPSLTATATSVETNDVPTFNPTAMSYVDNDDVMAYPIPATTVVHFAYKVPDSSGIVELRIYNTSFRIVKLITDETTSGNGQLTWDVSDIAPGIYFYRMRIGDKQLSVKRLVIAR